jgi:putative ABC transport system permease protein
MLKNYLKIALRTLWKNKTYSFINLVGLAVGMAASIIILLYVRFELTYDRFHENADQVYRVILEEDLEAEHRFTSRIPEAVANVAEGKYPELERVVTLIPYQKAKTIKVDEQFFLEDGLVEAEENFFQVFSFEAHRGDLKSALHAPHTAVITESAAHRYFGTKNPIGKTISYEKAVLNGNTLSYVEVQFQITAVIHDPPEHSHLDFNLITRHARSDDLTWSRFNRAVTYFHLTAGADASSLEEKLKALVAETHNLEQTSSMVGPYIVQESIEHPEEKYILHLQPLTDIHLHPDYKATGFMSDIVLTISIFSIVAFIILLIACLNYLNLATAQAIPRIREVGVRKTVGARKKHVILQFIGESMLLSLAALLLAVLLVELFLPGFNAITGKQLDLTLAAEPIQLLIVLVTALIVGIAGGIYPALRFSSYDTTQVLKAGLPGKPASQQSRNVMVVVQFVISIALIVSTIVIHRQMDLVRDKRADIGQDEIVLLEPFEGRIFQHYEAFRQELTSRPEVVDVAFGILPEAYHSIETVKDSSGNTVWIHEVEISENFFELLGLDVSKGRSFHGYDAQGSRSKDVIISEKTAKLMGLTNPVGAIYREGSGRIIGVLDEYHVQPLYKESEPVVFNINTSDNVEETSKIYIRLSGGSIQQGLELIRDVWGMFLPNQQPSISFFDDTLDQSYRTDLIISQILRWFTLLAIIIAAMGLFGLSRFAAERRTKEIGIRKVVGASVTQLVTMLNREFLLLVVIANLFAWPIAWYFSHQWLRNFAYRIDLSIWTFVLVGLLVVLIGLITVSWQTIKAARTNPVDTLRYE